MFLELFLQDTADAAKKRNEVFANGFNEALAYSKGMYKQLREVVRIVIASDALTLSMTIVILMIVKISYSAPFPG